MHGDVLTPEESAGLGTVRPRRRVLWLWGPAFVAAIAYVDPAFAEVGTAVEVDLRGKLEPFEVVALPFYKRNN